MAEVKISELTSATTPLAGTETVPIVQGGVTKKVAVSEIGGGGGVAWGDITGSLPSQTDLQSVLDNKQNVLVSGTNIKTINSNSLLGSGNIAISGNPSAVGIQSGNATVVNTAGASISKTITIAANTLSSSCVLDFTARMVRLTGTSSMGFIQVYKNTSNSLTGATMIAKAALFSGTDNTNVIQRTFTITGGNIVFHNSVDPQNTDVITSSQAIGTTTFSVSTTNYILIAINNSATDQLVINMAKLTQYA